MAFSTKARFLPVLFGAVLALPVFAGTPPPDEIFFFDPFAGKIASAELPAGPAAPATSVTASIQRLFVMPSGQKLAVATETLPQRTSFNELLADGSLRRISYLPDMSPFQPFALDLATDARGRLFLLRLFGSSYPAFSLVDLLEIDPATGTVSAGVSLPVNVQGIARAGDGLWAVAGGLLRRLDPDTGRMEPPVADLRPYGGSSIFGLEVDSAGRLFFLRNCGQQCSGSPLAFYDPATGGVEEAPAALYAETPQAMAFAIARGAAEPADPNALYLRQGRFRVEVTYAAYDGAAGRARTAPARSNDTGIFYFFRADNWELMVKVLDGCSINSRYWVYSAASTDVEYTMTVTDTRSGAQQVYTNPLGRIALTVTDNQAFACSP